MKNKKVLITGAGGFIGSHLTERLVKEAKSVRAFVHYNSRNDNGLLDQLDKEVIDSIEVIASDVVDPVAVTRAMKDVDIVFHLAALIGIPYSYYSPNSYLETNIKGTLNVLNAARELDVSKVVHTSTSEVYGTAIYTPIDEKHPLQAQSPYSATKIAADKLAESYYLSFGLPVTTVRPFNTFGPRQSMRAVIPTIITQALGNKIIKLGNISTVRDFNYVEDTVNGFIKMAQTDANNGKAINIGTGVGVSINQLIGIIESILETKLEIEMDSYRLRPDNSEVYTLICDATLANNVVSWQPEYTLEQGLKETIKWYEKNLDKLLSRSDKYIV